jgi:hypothetical protein
MFKVGDLLVGKNDDCYRFTNSTKVVKILRFLEDWEATEEKDILVKIMFSIKKDGGEVALHDTFSVKSDCFNKYKTKIHL